MARRRGDDLGRAGDLPAQSISRIPLPERRAGGRRSRRSLHVGAKRAGGAHQFSGTRSPICEFPPCRLLSLGVCSVFRACHAFLRYAASSSRRDALGQDADRLTKASRSEPLQCATLGNTRLAFVADRPLVHLSGRALIRSRTRHRVVTDGRMDSRARMTGDTSGMGHGPK